MADETIVIEYQLTKEDFAKFSACTNTNLQKKVSTKKHSIGIFKGMLLGILIAIIGQIIFNIIVYGSIVRKVQIDYPPEEKYSPIFVFGLLFLVLIVATKFATKFHYKYYYKCALAYIETGKNKVLFSPSKIIISNKIIKNTSDSYESTLLWDGVEKVVIQDSDLCLYISSLSAFIIPSRFFKSEEHKNEVFQKCQQWFSEANKEGQNVA